MICISPGAYKGSIAPVQAGQIIGSAIGACNSELLLNIVPVSDGGEGTLEVFSHWFGGRMCCFPALDPLGRQILADALRLPDGSVVLESAEVVGISLIREQQLNPFSVTSLGLGKLIRQVIAMNTERIVITMGDSATMDLGLPMLWELGAKFYNSKGVEIFPNLDAMSEIVDVDFSFADRLKNRVEFFCLLDTDDRFGGGEGQVALYGRQKGLSVKKIEIVNAAYSRVAEIIRRSVGVDLTQLGFAGGSGGISGILQAILGAGVELTTSFLARETDIIDRIESATLTITGEGFLDRQTKRGKVPHFVAQHSRGDCYCFVGGYDSDGFSDLRAACPSAKVVELSPVGNGSDARMALYESASRLDI